MLISLPILRITHGMFYIIQLVLFMQLVNNACLFMHVFREKTGVHSGNLFMSFRSIFQDVRAAMDYVHIHGALQNETVAVINSWNFKW